MVTTFLDALMDWARDEDYTVYWSERAEGWVVTVVCLTGGGRMHYTKPEPTLEQAAERMLAHVTKED